MDGVLDGPVVQDYPPFWEQYRTVSAQSSATICGTMVRGSDGQSQPWLLVSADHLAVENSKGSLCELLPVLQPLLCNLPVLAVERVIPVAEGQQSMAVLVGSKQFARIEGGQCAGPHHRGTSISARRG